MYISDFFAFTMILYLSQARSQASSERHTRSRTVNTRAARKVKRENPKAGCRPISVDAMVMTVPSTVHRDG